MTNIVIATSSYGLVFYACYVYQLFLVSLLALFSIPSNKKRCICSTYYHPANSNNSSELLHVFISCLCTYFVDRVHIERYNKKWETKVQSRIRDILG